METGYGIAFDGLASQSLVMTLMVIYGVDNSSSSHTDNRKYIFFSVRLRTHW